MSSPFDVKSTGNDKVRFFDASTASDDGRETAKDASKSNGHLAVEAAFRAQSPGTLSNLSIDDHGQVRLGRSPFLSVPALRHVSLSPVRPQEFRGRMQAFWIKNKGLALVLIAQIFNCLMAVATRLLEVEGRNGKGFHPLQILFVRMGITVVLASSYMWWRKTEHFPLGAKGVRLLLILRGISGFFGVFGMYYSLLYLPLADATVLTFLAPLMACIICSYLLKEPFTRTEQIATFVSLFGVVIIARPTSIFSLFESTPTPSASGASDFTPPLNATKHAVDAKSYDSVTPHQKAVAIVVALMGVMGGAWVITSLRWIGKRAHPLLTVNYFAIYVVIVSGVISALIPSIGFAMPGDFRDWCFLIFLGTCGFTSQFLSAAGMQYEKSSRATNMIYTQMFFALAMDKLVFGHNPELLSVIGSGLILGAAICVAVKKEGETTAASVEPHTIVSDEEIALVEAMDSDDDESDLPTESIPMREVPPMPHTDKLVNRRPE